MRVVEAGTPSELLRAGGLLPGDTALPARLVDPPNGRLVWMLDRAAAAKLERKS